MSYTMDDVRKRLITPIKKRIITCKYDIIEGLTDGKFTACKSCLLDYKAGAYVNDDVKILTTETRNNKKLKCCRCDYTLRLNYN